MILLNTVQAADGAHWNGGTYLRATSITAIDGLPSLKWARPPYARAGACAYWFSAPSTVANRRMAISAVYPHLYADAPDATPSVLIEHYPVSGGTRLHLLVQLQGAVTSKIDAFSITSIPYFSGNETPASKHHLMVLWDSWQGLVQFKLDGQPMGLDPQSSSVGVPFDFAADSMSWTVGAQLIPGSQQGVFVPTNFLSGDTNQVYCVLGDSVYTVLTTPEPVGSTTYVNPIYFKYNPTTRTTTGPYPTAMGPLCLEIFGVSRESPYLCMRGVPPNFQGNDGLGIFSTFGTLTPALYSPFDLLPTTNP